MDTKQLYRLYERKFYVTNWLNEDGESAQSEGDVKWYYCGVGDDFKYKIVSHVINNTFTDDEVYLCISSGNSSLVSKSIAIQDIGNLLHKKEIGVMDKSFTKIIHFTQYGVFQSGIIREFPKSRPKPTGKLLEVSFHANILDKSTQKVADVVHERFRNLGRELHDDYGGSMEHLWIDLELLESRPKPYPFRFQKRVSLPASYTEFYTYNVGHYSVRPDFEKLRCLSSEEAICKYVFSLLYDSTQILVDNQKKLGGFDAIKFRSNFLSACEKIGYI